MCTAFTSAGGHYYVCPVVVHSVKKLGKFTTKGIVGQGIMRRPDGHWTASNSGIVKGGLARQQLGFSIVLKQIAESLL